MVLGIIGYTGFLLKLRFFMQPWYYVEILILCAISLDGILTASWPALRPWGLMRIGFPGMMMILNAGPAWARSAHPSEQCQYWLQLFSAGTLRRATSSWSRTHGRVSRLTGIIAARLSGLAYLRSIRNEVHCNDLVMAKMNQPEAMTPVLHAIANTLASGHNVWLVGSIPIARWKDVPPGPTPLPPPPVGNADRMVVRIVFILVEPTGYNAPAGSRAAGKVRGICCATDR